MSPLLKTFLVLGALWLGAFLVGELVGLEEGSVASTVLVGILFVVSIYAWFRAIALTLEQRKKRRYESAGLLPGFVPLYAYLGRYREGTFTKSDETLTCAIALVGRDHVFIAKAGRELCKNPKKADLWSELGKEIMRARSERILAIRAVDRDDTEVASQKSRAALGDAAFNFTIGKILGGGYSTIVMEAFIEIYVSADSGQDVEVLVFGVPAEFGETSSLGFFEDLLPAAVSISAEVLSGVGEVARAAEVSSTPYLNAQLSAKTLAEMVRLSPAS